MSKSGYLYNLLSWLSQLIVFSYVIVFFLSFSYFRKTGNIPNLLFVMTNNFVLPIVSISFCFLLISGILFVKQRAHKHTYGEGTSRNQCHQSKIILSLDNNRLNKICPVCCCYHPIKLINFIFNFKKRNLHCRRCGSELSFFIQGGSWFYILVPAAYLLHIAYEESSMHSWLESQDYALWLHLLIYATILFTIFLVLGLYMLVLAWRLIRIEGAEGVITSRESLIESGEAVKSEEEPPPQLIETGSSSQQIKERDFPTIA